MEILIGRVTHFYNRLSVAVVALTGDLKVNDILHFYGHSTDFLQKAWSMEIDHSQVQSVGIGQEVAIKVAEPVRRGDRVFCVQEPSDEEKSSILI